MHVDVLTAHNHEAVDDVRVFDSERLPADREVLAQLRRGIEDADLAAPAVVLPDFHHKSKMEMPSSIAVATRDSIRPTLTSSSLNCGMALMTLDLERPGPEAVSAFYRLIRERYPYPPTNRLEISGDDVVRCATEGAQFAVDRLGMEPTDLDRIEEGGRVSLERLGGAERLRKQLPWLVKHLSRLRFGSIGPSNHFVELQEVEEVLDRRAADLLGVYEGQVTLQYHAGGGALTGEFGRMFGRRKDYPRDVRAQMAVTKPLFHLATARSLDELRTRFQLYFAGACPPVPRDHPEGQRLLLANAAAMNYGFAFRATTYAALGRLAAQAFGDVRAHLIVDSPHNSIYEEELDGQSVVMHRHNSCRAFPASMMKGRGVFGETGQALLLPGTNRTSSFLCVAGERSSRSLHSACHGAGTVIDEFVRKGFSGTDPQGRSTLRFRYDDAAPTEVAHVDDKGVDEAVGILVNHHLVRPVARLRPFAVLN